MANEIKNLSEYTQYPLGTKVRIKETDEEGLAFESASGFTSIQVDGEATCRFFRMSDIQFINNERSTQS